VKLVLRAAIAALIAIMAAAVLLPSTSPAGHRPGSGAGERDRAAPSRPDPWVRRSGLADEPSRH